MKAFYKPFLFLLFIFVSVNCSQAQCSSSGCNSENTFGALDVGDCQGSFPAFNIEPVTSDWDFGDGNTATTVGTTGTTHVYSSPGTYCVSRTVNGVTCYQEIEMTSCSNQCDIVAQHCIEDVNIINLFGYTITLKSFWDFTAAQFDPGYQNKWTANYNTGQTNTYGPFTNQSSQWIITEIYFASILVRELTQLRFEAWTSETCHDDTYIIDGCRYLVEAESNTADISKYPIINSFIENEVKVFQNSLAVGENINVQLPEAFTGGIFNVQLFDLSGRLISERQVSAGDYEIPTFGSTKGLHILRFSSKEGINFSKKIILH